jgi:hypothetical protein
MNALEDELRSTLNRAAGLTAPGAGFAADALVRGRALRRRRRPLASTAVAGVATVVLAVSLLGNPVTGTSPAPAGPTKGPVCPAARPRLIRRTRTCRGRSRTSACPTRSGDS